MSYLLSAGMHIPAGNSLTKVVGLIVELNYVLQNTAMIILVSAAGAIVAMAPSFSRASEIIYLKPSS